MIESSALNRRDGNECAAHSLTTRNETQTKQERKVVGLFWQVLILTKKNFILARRNVVGTLGELFVALLFVLILLLIRYVSDVERYADQANILANSTTPYATNANPINYVAANINISSSFTPIIYYYPDNDYVRNITIAACNIIQARQPRFNATSKR